MYRTCIKVDVDPHRRLVNSPLLKPFHDSTDILLDDGNCLLIVVKKVPSNNGKCIQLLPKRTSSMCT